MATPRSVRLLVSGRVQGVFFRESTRVEARRHGVAGWVRNLPDGRVEAAFVGPPDAVSAMVAWCRRGPGAARVDRVEIVGEAIDVPDDRFDVRPTPAKV